MLRLPSPSATPILKAYSFLEGPCSVILFHVPSIKIENTRSGNLKFKINYLNVFQLIRNHLSVLHETKVEIKFI